jgi:hypothetical protein
MNSSHLHCDAIEFKANKKLLPNASERSCSGGRASSFLFAPRAQKQTLLTVGLIPTRPYSNKSQVVSLGKIGQRQM